VAGVAVAALSVAHLVPSRDLTGDLPSAGALALFHNLDRGWPALQSAVTTLFDYDLWLVVVPLVGVGVVLAFLAGARTLPTYALTLYALVLAGLVWVLWSFTELELPFVQDEGVNPIVRPRRLSSLYPRSFRSCSTPPGVAAIRRWRSRETSAPLVRRRARGARIPGRDARGR
jgi:hypothetical protein